MTIQIGEVGQETRGRRFEVTGKLIPFRTYLIPGERDDFGTIFSLFSRTSEAQLQAARTLPTWLEARLQVDRHLSNLFQL